jgi:hypothetical protein
MGARSPAKGGSGAAGAAGRGERSFRSSGGHRECHDPLTDAASASKTAGHGAAFGEGAAPGWGTLSTPLPTRAWPRAGPVTPSPVRSYASAVKEMSAADARPALRNVWGWSSAHSPKGSLHRPFYAGTPEWNEGSHSVFPHQALRRDAVWCSPSEACWISELRECGYAGLRDA